MVDRTANPAGEVQKSDWGITKSLEKKERLSLFELRIETGKQIPMHRHPAEAESLFVNRGQVRICINHYCRKLHTGETIFIPMDAPHSVSNTGNEESVLIKVLQKPFK